MEDDASKELPSSALGTLDYWETTYATEMKNFQDHEDIGEVWFGGANSASVIKYICTQLALSKESDRIVDLGCGNGWTCVQLAKAGFKKLCGVDYSLKAVELARKIAADEDHPEIEFFVCDMVDGENQLKGTKDFKFKLAHDKGTYDAVGLCPDDPKQKRRKYIENVHSAIEDGGFFILVSCNWTKEELIEHFQDYFEFSQQIPTKTLSFGGQTGNTVTILVFVKKTRGQ
ncbi:EEF1A lysine methyltransferase 2 [Copidosoma floridanum]|uniref:EEF1A lysine methyltransferase 2 n=1 Tax=Copidosoma floridanum TaxID=29053 RepID=UPI0006C98C61|nr:EEF1A lysine methyltransferase 2 [Copidosoma floridanum]